jgi:hypothetical protein
MAPAAWYASRTVPSVTKLVPVYYDGYETPVYYTGRVTTLTFSKIGGFWLVLRWLRGTVRITIVT